MKKRKQYLLDKKFQLRLTFRVVYLIVFAVFLSGISSYIISINIEKRSKIQLFGIADALGNETYKISRAGVIKPVIRKAIGISAALSIIIAGFAVFLYSHRLAGPVYHLNKHLKDIIAGNYDNNLSFRKKDEFKQLADTLNELQEKLKSGST